MFRYLKNARIDFELPAPVAVCGILFAGTLTKLGHPEWAIAASVTLYLLHLALQYPMRRADVLGQGLPSSSV
jgi:hypothetical protein